MLLGGLEGWRGGSSWFRWFSKVLKGFSSVFLEFYGVLRGEGEVWRVRSEVYLEFWGFSSVFLEFYGVSRGGGRIPKVRARGGSHGFGNGFWGPRWGITGGG